MRKVSPALASATVLSRSGEPVVFEKLYQGNTTLVVFVRHFGCKFCRERIAQLGATTSALDALGVKTCVVGNGTPLMAESFAEDLNLTIPLYTDPSRKTYALAGMNRKFGLGVASIGHALRSWRSGHRQGAVAGDVWQQGGLLAITPDGTVLESHEDEGAGDYIDLDGIVARLAQAHA